jgi:hypothetical protein
LRDLVSEAEKYRELKNLRKVFESIYDVIIPNYVWDNKKEEPRKIFEQTGYCLAQLIKKV